VEDSFFDAVVKNLWVPETFAKIAFILVTMPFWLPLAKVMYREILPALNAPEDAVVVRRPPGEDPFLNIPLASFRSRRAESRASVGPRRRR